MSIWTSKIDGWLEAQIHHAQYPPEPDEVARDAALLRVLGLMGVVLLVIMTLIARSALKRGDTWLALLLGV